MTDTLVERLLEEMDASPVDDVTCINRAELTLLRDRIIALEAEIENLKSIVQGWHYLAVGPDEMGDYYTQKQLIKASEPYASPALAHH